MTNLETRAKKKIKKNHLLCDSIAVDLLRRGQA